MLPLLRDAWHHEFLGNLQQLQHKIRRIQDNDGYFPTAGFMLKPAERSTFAVFFVLCWLKPCDVSVQL